MSVLNKSELSSQNACLLSYAGPWLFCLSTEWNYPSF